MLLHGPPGCGKTLVARSVAAEFDAEVHEVSAASVFGAYTGIMYFLQLPQPAPASPLNKIIVKVWQSSTM